MGGFYEELFAGPARHGDDHDDREDQDDPYDNDNGHGGQGGDADLRGEDAHDGHDLEEVAAPGTSPLDAALQDLVRNWPESEPLHGPGPEPSQDDEIAGTYGDEADGDAAGNPTGGRP